MGFLSKKKDDGEDSNRTALFGSRKKSDKAPTQSNPCTPHLHARHIHR